MYKNNIFKKSLFMNAIYHILNRFTLINNSLIESILVDYEKKIQKAKNLDEKLKIYSFLDILVSNSNKIEPKPSPEPYIFAMKKLKAKKKNTLIFEDSPVGILSAKRSGANYFIISNPNKINIKFLTRILK